MKKINTICFIITLLLSIWCSMSNAMNGMAITEGQARKLTPLNPLQFIDDLSSTKAFAKLIFKKNSFTLYSLPINTPHTNLVNKWLITFTVNNVPKKWPLNFKTVSGLGNIQSESDVVINTHTFHKITTWDAAMCRQENYEFYIFKQKRSYLVFEFILDAICVGVDDTRTTAYDYANEAQDFQNTVSSLKQKH